MSFLTVEDINGVVFNNQGCYWYTIDIADITTGTEDLDEVKLDFCKVTRTKTEQGYEFFVKVDNSNWIGYSYSVASNWFVSIPIARNGGLEFISLESNPNLKLYFYLGTQEWLDFTQFEILNPILDLNLKELGEEQTIRARHWQYDTISTNVQLLNQGYNKIVKGISNWGYVLVNLLKTDFQFTCTDTVYLGKVNTVRLGADTDYKPNGDLIGEYTPTITVEYNGETLPVTWDNTLNDYTFQLDLTNEADLNKVKFNVNIESNKVLNHTITEVTLTPTVETITTLQQLTSLFSNGGIGRLGANITVNNPLTIKEDTLLIGDNKILSFGYTHQLIISEDKTFKADSVEFKRGKHTIHQKTGSIVEITNSVFTECEGVGSCIECDIDFESLDNPNDFTTILSNCTFNNNYMPILHGGELTVTDSSIDSVLELGDTYNFTDYPYFLYQTDGNAVLTGNTFAPLEWRHLGTDLKFHPCIFTCGETATINGLSHTELQENNLTSFISRDKNQSSIDMEYDYVPISGFIHLSSDNGYCHSVSGVDYVFKTNVNITRGE